MVREREREREEIYQTKTSEQQKLWAENRPVIDTVDWVHVPTHALSILISLFCAAFDDSNNYFLFLFFFFKKN